MFSRLLVPWFICLFVCSLCSQTWNQLSRLQRNLFCLLFLVCVASAFYLLALPGLDEAPGHARNDDLSLARDHRIGDEGLEEDKPHLDRPNLDTALGLDGHPLELDFIKVKARRGTRWSISANV